MNDRREFFEDTSERFPGDLDIDFGRLGCFGCIIGRPFVFGKDFFSAGLGTGLLSLRTFRLVFDRLTGFGAIVLRSW